MGKYKSLVSNTLIFAVGTFSSKMLSFFMSFILTHIMTRSEISLSTNIVAICNLILPVMYLSISEAVIRFGMDTENRKRDIFTTGILTVWIGYLVLLCLFPLVNLITVTQGRMWLVYLFILTSASRTVITHFVRASGFVRLFALDGMLTTFTTVGFILLFIMRFDMGVTGYVLGTVCADGLSAIGLVLLLRLYRFFHIKGLNKDLAKAMLRYSIPLVPTAIFWWVTNLSDHFFVTKYCGDDINGLYATAYKIPTLITLVSYVFTQAWQLSAFTEYKNPEGERFFSTIFKSYYTFVFLAASGIIIMIKPITLVWQEDFHDSWRYVPFLVLSACFSCLVTFLGTVYNAAKKNGMVTVTTAIGAVLNLLLNWVLISNPKYGAQGAAFATFFSFFVVFIIRAVDTKKYIHIRMQPWRIGLNLALLLVQVWVCLREFKYGILLQVLVFLLLVVCNLGCILFMVRRVLELLLPKRRRA